MYTAAAAMRPYKLDKQIAFLLPHVSFRDEDDNGNGSCNDEDTSSLADKTNECDSISMYDHQQAADMQLFEQSNSLMDKACSEHDALDRSIHFLCDQRYKAAATNYKWVCRLPVTARGQPNLAARLTSYTRERGHHNQCRNRTSFAPLRAPRAGLGTGCGCFRVGTRVRNRANFPSYHSRLRCLGVRGDRPKHERRSMWP